ncbi:MAG: riboflavin biosynthesis protein RibF [Synergistaceae bacterium]|nr:riboflavin biosynthesis protein RibF [Synergistaceae bacterium]
MILTIGAFDGFHRGHERLLEETRALAATTGQDWGVVTFQPHPGVFLGALSATLLTPRERDLLRRVLGVPHLLPLRFDKELRSLSPEEFWRRLKRAFGERGLSVGGVVVGQDFSFGRDGAGTAETLAELCREDGLRSKIVRLLERGGVRYSSTEARANVLAGDLRGAADILGYPWFLWSRVVSGDRRGRTMGFPTANLDLSERRVLPASGVYATALPIDGRWYAGALSLGNNPTFGDVNELRAEVFVLDFSGDLYGAELPVFFLDRLRPMTRFADAQSLAAQIERDAAQCREVFRQEMDARSSLFTTFASHLAEAEEPDVWRLSDAD